MHLVLTEDGFGTGLQLEGESVGEWQTLDDLAASGIRTCGPEADDVLLRLYAIGEELEPACRIVGRGWNLAAGQGGR